MTTESEGTMERKRPHTGTSWISQRVDDESGDIYWAIHAADGYEFITNVYSSKNDARLIAAAPALLEALIETRDLLEANRAIDNSTYPKIIAAIAEATT